MGGQSGMRSTRNPVELVEKRQQFFMDEIRRMAMKGKFVTCALLSALWSVSASAENTGCGLGTIAFEGKQGLAPQVLAVTTNGISGNQTFGISSGTLGCERDGIVQSDVTLSMYIGSNMDMLARDMSVGSGDSLEVMADLMDVDAEDRSHFFATLQQHYGTIFSSMDVTTEQVMSAIDETMKTDDRLTPYRA